MGSHKENEIDKPGEPSMVDHPPHYNLGKIEVIEFIEDQKLGYHLGNALKYICRNGKKNKTPYGAIEDLCKARWYIQREIELIEAELGQRNPLRPNDMGKKG